jgi:hypothetical protein
MQNDGSKPWDARLTEWMQRGSSTAKSAAWTPRTRAFYALIYVILAITYGGWFFYIIAGLLVAVSLGLGLRELRQRR